LRWLENSVLSVVSDEARISIARNKRARHDYHILETWEAGVVLTGTEVKSLRAGKANIGDAYGIVRDGEVYLLNLHIPQYEQGGYANHEPDRTRKLLLHRREIRKLIGAVERQGLTLIPLEVYFTRGRAKVAIGLARGKKEFDKRADQRRKDDERDMQRAMRRR
jgi:SsrA-binding protein